MRFSSQAVLVYRQPQFVNRWLLIVAHNGVLSIRRASMPHIYIPAQRVNCIQ